MKGSNPHVAVVILSWNGVSFLEKFLPSIMQSTYDNLTVIIADNNSTDHSESYIQSGFPSVIWMDLEENLGYAGGYNKALKKIEADYYVLLNQDIEVTPDWLEPVIQLMEADDSIAACQPKIRSFHDKQYFEYAGASGGFIDHYGYPFCRGRIFGHLEKDGGQYDEPLEIFWATGAALFIRSPLYHSIGGLDESFFAHMEEIDLCWRLKNSGYKIMVCPSSTVFHVGGGSLPQGNPRKTYLNYRNNLIMMIKNYPGNVLWWKLPFRFFLDFLSWLQSLAKGSFKDAWAINKAHFQVIFRLGKWFKHRKSANQQVKKASNGPSTKTGVYKRSIVFEHFLKKKMRFSDLNKQDFS